MSQLQCQLSVARIETSIAEPRTDRPFDTSRDKGALVLEASGRCRVQ